MNDLKCRYCGGNITDSGDGTGKCDSCGSLLAMPKPDGRISAELYNRADHLRRIHDYDGAVSAYEHIVAEHPADPEARWSLVLCKYGVEYTYDRRTDSYLPTINRMSLDSILEDRDYLKALEYSEGTAKEEYRRQALQLSAIQDELEKIVRENENYDVFISFKATDENRKRTRDYALAQEIYDTLSASGLRVFFSPVSLRAHVGEVYEPYIFAALYSSKVMVLVGTKREYLESEWVKNEWSRYLFMARTDPRKHILPVCEGMKPGEFPAGIGKMQAVSMNVVGALELIRERVTGFALGEEKRIYVKNAAGEQMDLTNQIRRLSFAVEDGDFEEAKSWIGRLRDEAAGKHPDIEYLALLVKFGARNVTELSAHMDEIGQDGDYIWLVQNGSEEQRESLLNLEEYRKEAERRESEKEFIKQLSGLYQSGRYGEIVRAVEEAQKHTAFGRATEIDDFYQRAKRLYDDERLLARYRETVGDGTEYFEKQLNKKHPERAGQLASLRESSEAALTARGKKLAGLGGFFGLGVLGAWFVFRDRLTTPVLLFDIAMWLYYTGSYFLEPEDESEKALSPRILIKSFVTIAASLLGFNLMLPGGLGQFGGIWGKLLDDGSNDGGMLAFVYLVPLIYIIMWGFRIRIANRSEKKKAFAAEQDKKEFLEFLKRFENQEELLLLDEYGTIDETERIPLQSIYKSMAD